MGSNEFCIDDHSITFFIPDKLFEKIKRISLFPRSYHVLQPSADEHVRGSRE